MCVLRILNVMGILGILDDSVIVCVSGELLLIIMVGLVTPLPLMVCRCKMVQLNKLLLCRSRARWEYLVHEILGFSISGKFYVL